MSYTVLARKYRSRNFDEIVGQDAIATTLRNAITSGRVHHGYLFTGTRGVGKTSMARILAKALNCLNADAPTTDPCGQCESCLAVAEGEDIDVVEIDGASNRGIDQIRDVISNAGYRPARARYKIYVIDEVHMLTPEAFNALLKTLEEPPGHVKFIFATTTPQKVPPTILSRVQRFDFRAIDTDKIARQLQNILKTENIDANESMVRRIARQANGSMRDALSLLDQALSLGADRLTPELIDEVLPVAYDADLATMIDAFADGDAAAALRTLDALLAKGYTLERFTEALVDQLRSLMLLNVCGPDSDLVDLPANVQEQARAQSGRFAPTQYVYMIALLEELRRNVRFNASARALADAAVVRLAQSSRFTEIEKLLARLESTAAEPPRSTARPTAKKKEADLTVPSPPSAPPPAAPGSPPTRTPSPTGIGAPTASPTSRPARTAGPDQRAVALADPLVQYAFELFDGVLAKEVEPLASDTLPGVESENVE